MLVFLKSLSILSVAINIALNSKSVESLPSSANSFNWSRGLLVARTKASKTGGKFSDIDLNSSPANLPDCRACVNCVKADLAS